jgi:hypothetical protein
MEDNQLFDIESLINMESISNDFSSDLSTDLFWDDQLNVESVGVEVFIKPAKSREDQYEGGNFPTSLLCNPYKYDLKVQGELSGDVTLLLVDAETIKVPESTKPAITVENVEKNSSRERIIRFSLNLCSFHYRRRSFRLALMQGDVQIYLSTPFRTYARRRDQAPQSPRKRKKSEPVVEQPIRTFNIQPNFTGGYLPGKRKINEIYTTPELLQFSAPCKYPNIQNVDYNLYNTHQTMLAIQLMSTLSPMQREAVNAYLSCMNNSQQVYSH